MKEKKNAKQTIKNPINYLLYILHERLGNHISSSESNRERKSSMEKESSKGSIYRGAIVSNEILVLTNKT